VWIIDRFEGEFAILEGDDGKLFSALRENLPHGCREGSVLRRQGEDFLMDFPQEHARREKLSQTQQNLFG
jgi:hypothetical protein